MSTAKFPDDPILVSLLTASQRVCEPAPMIYDIAGFVKSYPHLLGDILATSRHLFNQLPKTVVQENGLLREEYPYVFLFCQSSYEYLVGFFAIRALGGAVMPLASGILKDEVLHFQKETKAACVLFGQDCLQKVQETFSVEMPVHGSSSFTLCTISTDAEPVVVTDISIDSDSEPLDPNGPGIVFLTSGTSGPPKAAVLPRLSLASQGLEPPGGAGINYRPGHLIGGADTMIMPILAGLSLHCIGQRATPEDILQAFVDHRITLALFGGPLLPRLKDIITGPTGVLSDEARSKYSTVFRGLATIMCGGGHVDPAVRAFWVNLTGVPVENFYASTEAGVRVCSSLSDSHGCIGLPIEGMEMKLSKEPIGELLIKGPTTFTHYIGNEEVSRAAFDDDGFLKSGDLAMYENGQYYILGREKIDYVRFRHLEFPTADVERALLMVPYITEACVIGVPLPDVTQLCAAVIRINVAELRHDSTRQAAPVSLVEVRCAIRHHSKLPTHALPFLLRVLDDDEKIPVTIFGKIAKGQVLETFLGGKELKSVSGLPDRVEVYGVIPSPDELGAAEQGSTVKAWDWGGLQTV